MILWTIYSEIWSSCVSLTRLINLVCFYCTANLLQLTVMILDECLSCVLCEQVYHSPFNLDVLQTNFNQIIIPVLVTHFLIWSSSLFNNSCYWIENDLTLGIHFFNHKNWFINDIEWWFNSILISLVYMCWIFYWRILTLNK